MRSQEHNTGELAELKVSIEADVIKSFKSMSANTGMSLEELVIIALKRFRASHSDYEGQSSRK